MKKQKAIELDFEIDKLTNSIENVITGDVHSTVVSLVNRDDMKRLKKNDWQFDWPLEFRNAKRSIYKLSITENLSVIHGLVSLEDKGDHIFMHLIESAKFNKGKGKLFAGVPGNLVAYACKNSFDLGYSGFVSFVSKSALIVHYENSLGAQVLFRNTMTLNSSAAVKLINRYFNEK